MTATRQPGPILRHILFDLDGTLVDSVRITCAIIDTMLAARGVAFHADPALARAMDAIGGEAMIAAVMGPHCRDPGIEIAEFRVRHAVVATPPDLAFPGVAEALAALASADIGLGICSNKPQHLCEKILTDLDLARYFGAIVGARSDLPRKPAPDGARLALAALGADPASTLYVGDSAVDAATARAAGLPLALVAWGYGLAGARAAAPEARVLVSLRQLLD
ncbi:HAD family hydrolase [Sandarakinorhabdus sp. AAP62]|uniref:HAD family hydrolase n=1 Tax=Sandarakinorhabdus sp. AAP62 TaxID=1248916 RepID=UPI0002E802F6|nr:HAD family hydrolase [Sandarakinorhabdus sp. AAP62]